MASKELGQRHRTHNKKPVWEMSKAELLDEKTVVFDHEDLVQYAEGDIADVFGPEFKVIDKYRRRVRLPASEYLLVTRVMLMDAEVNNYRVGARMVTEYDVPVNGVLSEGGDVPWAVLVEAGQCDLMLISYMGIDFQCKGERVYRLLNTTLTFFGVAKEGETLVYDIRVTGFAKRPDGDISMFFFEYDCYCNGKLLIKMRDGCAGFFSDEELAVGKGVVLTKGDILKRSRVVKATSNPLMVAPSLHKTSCNENEMKMLVNRNWGDVFGMGNGMGKLDYKLCATKMLMIDRMLSIDPKGGIYGLGQIIGEKVLERHHWYFPCHFVKDEVMAGSLVSDGCSQMLKAYMIWLGLHTEIEAFDFVPVSGMNNKVRCRGQISPHKGKLVYVMEIKEMGRDTETGDPYAVADVNIIDVNEELGQSFSMADLPSYGRGDLSRKIVVDFQGIALRMKRRTTAKAAPLAVDLRHEQPPTDCLATDPAAPLQVTWHPMAKIAGNPTPSFSPSAYSPRAVCFKPFPGNPLDNNHTPGEMPLNWFNMSEFMCGKVSNCLGPEFQRFDVSKTSRSPAFDLALVTRVVSVDNIEPKKIYNIDINPGKGNMVGEFDCPAQTWFFDGSCNDSHMPYSILMEIGLQTSGVLTSVLKAPLTMDKDDILFRNLDAESEMLVPGIDLRGKTIRNDTKCTGYSMMGTMGIHRFTFVLSTDGQPFYKGSTSFGWFTPEVFVTQAGLDNGKKSEPWWVENNVSAGSVKRFNIGSAAGKAQLFADSMGVGVQLARRTQQCEFLDYCNVIADSGKFGKGYAHGHKDVNKQDWFFSCHFWFDPVMPGSLGIESMFQLIEAFCVERGLPATHGITNPTFSHAKGKTSWKYRGQLTPKNNVMDSEVHIKEIVIQSDSSVEVIADGSLWVDGLRVYSANNLRLRIVQGSLAEKPVTTPAEMSVATMQPISGGRKMSTKQLKKALLDLDRPLYLSTDPRSGDLIQHDDRCGGTVTAVPPCTISDLGDKGFMEMYGVVAPLYTGAMAKGIASADLVIAAGKRKILGSFGAGGLPMHHVRAAVEKIQAALPHGPYAVNLIHSPFDSNLEKGCIDLMLEKGVRVVEASAFMTLTPQVVRYRAAGLSRNTSGGVTISNHIISKVSRTELAEMFIRPAPEKLLMKLVASGEITTEQAELAKLVPMADDICVEADSGGHTDNRPIHVILPLIIAVRNRVARELNYPPSLRPRVGGGGGVGCPLGAVAAFNMGAAFLVTGTVNQVCKQSGTCDYVREALSKASYSDVAMAAAADMFDEGVKLQVLKKGTMFASKANKLYEFYSKYDSFESMPANERANVEKRIFKKSLDEVWSETKDFYINALKNPDKIERAEKDGKLKMSLCCKWYLGLASFWANNGVMDRKLDYQIWCGPAIGAFNDFIRGSYLDPAVSSEFPCVVQVNMQILRGASYHQRLLSIKSDPSLAIDQDDYELVYAPESPL